MGLEYDQSLSSGSWCGSGYKCDCEVKVQIQQLPFTWVQHEDHRLPRRLVLLCLEWPILGGWQAGAWPPALL